jgi:hypothetical protein
LAFRSGKDTLMSMAEGLTSPRLSALRTRIKQPQRSFLYLLLFLFLLPVASCAETPGTTQYNEEKAPLLLPEHPRRGERLVCGTTRVYRVLNLRLDAAYDVKLSYPATVPTEFSLEVRRVLAVASSSSPAVVDGPRRRVLNTAKLRLLPRELLLRGADDLKQDAFQLDPSALAEAGDATLSLELAVRGRVEGVSRVLDLDNRECVFDIVVEELVLGGQIPRESLLLVAWLVAVLALAAWFVFPFLKSKIALERPEDQGEIDQDDHKQS